jgi:NADH-quinone oxidoreductase subunit N
MLIAALAFKAGAVPFHSWAPDAYENASPSSSAFLSSGPKIAAITALAILVSITSVAAITVPIQAALTLLAVLSILVGSVTALRQTSYTRMLGYAGVAQVGYALVAIATISRPVLATFFIASYALASTASFLAADAFRSVRPDWDGTIEGLSGIGREAPVLGVAASVTLISLAGIPPLIGFWGKFTVFYSAALGGLLGLTAGNSLSAWLALAAAVAGIVGSIVSLGYYGAVLRALFAPAPGDEGDDSRARARAGSAGLAVAVLAIAIVATGLIPLDTGIDWVVRLFS